MVMIHDVVVLLCLQCAALVAASRQGYFSGGRYKRVSGWRRILNSSAWRTERAFTMMHSSTILQTSDAFVDNLETVDLVQGTLLETWKLVQQIRNQPNISKWET